LLVYLDSSAIIKRYVKEPGSEYVRKIYLRAYTGDVVISYSLWNVGEVLGVLDRARRLGRLDEKTYTKARLRFLIETRRMAKLGIAVIVPVKSKLLRDSWVLVEKYHIYQADALQIATAKLVRSEQFITGDKDLYSVAVEEGLSASYLH